MLRYYDSGYDQSVRQFSDLLSSRPDAGGHLGTENTGSSQKIVLGESKADAANWT